MKNRLNLVALNARDFDYNFLYVDPLASKNIESLNHSDRPLPIRQSIQLATTCGYRGGCNALKGADQGSLGIKVIGLPAVVQVKLWKERPAQVSDRQDFTVRLDLE